MTSPEPAEHETHPAVAAVVAMVMIAGYAAISIGPFVLAEHAGAGWGVLAGIVLPIGWLATMPSTCWNGGLLWSMLGMWQFALCCLWTIRGVVLLVALVF